jgi:nitroreductase
MELSEAMRTTAAVREFTDEPVPDEVLHGILDDARFAPSGGNRQGWRVAVVRDPALRRRLAEACAPASGEYYAQLALGETPFSVLHPTRADLEVARREPTPNPMLERLEEVPVVLVVAVDLATLAVADKDLARPSIVGGASVYPFCQNLLLAARDRDLGGVMTTFLARVEDDVRDDLGLPRDHAIAAMVLLGHPRRRVQRLRRRPVEEFVTIDRFDGPAFSASGPAGGRRPR